MEVLITVVKEPLEERPIVWWNGQSGYSEKTQKEILDFVSEHLKPERGYAISDIDIHTKGENSRTGVVWWNGENSLNDERQTIIRAHISSVTAGRKPKFEERKDEDNIFPARYYYGGQYVSYGDSGLSLSDIMSGISTQREKKRRQHDRVIDHIATMQGKAAKLEEVEKYLVDYGYNYEKSQIDPYDTYSEERIYRHPELGAVSVSVRNKGHELIERIVDTGPYYSKEEHDQIITDFKKGQEALEKYKQEEKQKEERVL